MRCALLIAYSRESWREIDRELRDLRVGSEGILVRFEGGVSGTFLPVVMLQETNPLQALRSKVGVAADTPVDRVLAFTTTVETLENACNP